jgi:pantothenate kinase type III
MLLAIDVGNTEVTLGLFVSDDTRPAYAGRMVHPPDVVPLARRPFDT